MFWEEQNYRLKYNKYYKCPEIIDNALKLLCFASKTY